MPAKCFMVILLFDRPAYEHFDANSSQTTGPVLNLHYINTKHKSFSSAVVVMLYHKYI